LGLSRWRAAANRGPEIATTAASAIQGGTNDTTHLFTVGILISQTAGTGLCTGALLAPNLVATARHCVASIPAGIACPSSMFGAVTAPANVVVTTDSDVRTDATRYAVSKIIIPTGANTMSVCGNDIALFILSQNISLPEYVTPIINPPMTDHTIYSTNVTVVGYGLSDPTDTAGTTAGIRRIKQNVSVDCIPNDPAFPNCFSLGGPAMTAAEFLSGSATCEGDSGASAFEQTHFNAGTWVSFGVHSRGGTSGTTCLPGIYTRFDAWGSLLIDAATQAAAVGGYALPTWAGGDGGSLTPPGGADGGSPPPVEADASSGSTSSGEAGASTGSSSGASQPAEGGAPSSAGSGDGADASSPATGRDTSNAATPAKGCACNVVGARRSGSRPGAAALVALGLALLTRARRARRGVGRERPRQAERPPRSGARFHSRIGFKYRPSPGSARDGRMISSSS
jgi:hypothetical protein